MYLFGGNKPTSLQIEALITTINLQRPVMKPADLYTIGYNQIAVVSLKLNLNVD